MSWARIYRLAMRTLPADLRRKHGPAMEGLFARELERACESGRLRSALAGSTGVCDVLRRGLYEWGRRGLAESKDPRRWSMHTLGQDVAHALKSLLRAPRFTAMVVLTLTLGIGTNSAVFSVVDAVLLRPLPFPDAGRVVNLAWEARTHVQTYLSGAKFQYWHDHARSLEAVATWRPFAARVGEGPEASGVQALAVSRDFLDVLGYAPALGRDFVAGEDVPDGPKVALISHAVWRARFGGAADVVGRTLRVNGEAHTIIGVLPESFAFPYEDEPVGVIVPLGLRVDPDDVAQNWPTIARLGDGVTRERAQGERCLAHRTLPCGVSRPGVRGAPRDDPRHVHRTLRGRSRAASLDPHGGGRAGAADRVRQRRQPLPRARRAPTRGDRAPSGPRREREADRAPPAGRERAGGARRRGTRSRAGEVGRGRTAGARADGATAHGRRRGGRSRDAVHSCRRTGDRLRLRGGRSVARYPHPPLRRVDGKRREGGGRARGRQGLLVAQAGLSTVLLVGAGLLVATLIGLRGVDAGFDPERLVAARFPFKTEGYETSQDRWELERRVVRQLAGSPDIAAIAGASSLPLERGINTPMTIAGEPERWGTVEWRAVTPGYFRTLVIGLVTGRQFEETDVEGAPPVAIINQGFARRYFPSQDPLGQRVMVGRVAGRPVDPSRVGPAVEIVGVARDIREVSLRADPRPTIYVPQAQASSRLTNVMETMPAFIARARQDRGDAERALTQALRAADPALPRPDVFPFKDLVAQSLARERFGATLLSVFSGLALSLTAFGLHAVLAYTVRRRRREIGIRVALGAGSPELLRMVVVQGIAPALLGIVLGLAASVGLSRVLAAYLWGVTPTDPMTLATVVMILVGVALVASWSPAREAVRLDPVDALRCE